MDIEEESITTVLPNHHNSVNSLTSICLSQWSIAAKRRHDRSDSYGFRVLVHYQWHTDRHGTEDAAERSTSVSQGSRKDRASEPGFGF